MSVAATSRRAPVDRAESRADRLLAALPLVGAYLLLVTYYAWHGTGHGSPWLFSDEIEYTQLSRSIAETGEAARRGEPHGPISLYSYVLAPVWWIDDTARAYEAAKYLGAFLMTSAMFPAYWLARMLVPAVPALFAAVATASIPAMPYSRLLITEVVAYPVATLCFFLMAKALATWHRAWLVAALVGVLVAPYVREQLRILAPTFVVAAAVSLWLTEPARRFRRDYGAVAWLVPGAVLVALVLVADKVGRLYSSYWFTARFEPDRLYDFATTSLAALTIGLGVAPVLFGLVALWRPQESAAPAFRAFAGIVVAAVPLFVVYTAAKATYLSTVFGNIISERNLIYLAPLFFVGTALFLARPRVSVPVLAAAALAVGHLVAYAQFQLDHYPYFDAPGLAVLAQWNRTFRATEPELEDLLLAMLLVSVLLALALLLAARARRVAHRALAVGAAALVGWSLIGANAFGDGINDLGNRLASGVPQPLNWVDRQTGGAPAFYLGQGIRDFNRIWTMEFWNRSLRHVGSLDYTAPGPGPAVTPRPAAVDGSVINDPPHVRWVVAEQGIDLRGTQVDEQFGGLWRLIRLDGPLRLRSAVTGVDRDGWMGGKSAFTRFGHDGGVRELRVALSRDAWGGPDRPGRVTVEVGTIRIVEQQEPRIGRVLATKTWTARRRRQRELTFRVAPPFRVEVTVDPTFSPVEFGGTDQRQLGVQVAYGYR